MKLPYTLVAVLALLASNAHAALILEIDPNANTWALVGSDTGAMEDVGGYGLVEWRITSVGGSSNGVSQLRTEKMWSTNVGQPGAAAFSNTDTQLSSTEVLSGTVTLVLSRVASLSQATGANKTAATSELHSMISAVL